MGDLKEAPAVHFNFPLLSFSLYITFKSGLPLPVSLFLRNRGGLVNGNSIYLNVYRLYLDDITFRGIALTHYVCD